MKFSIRTDYGKRADYPSFRSIIPGKAEEKSAGKAGSFDTVSLQRRATADDEGFLSALSKSTAEAVRRFPSEKRVAELQQQVQSGSYQVNAGRIAEKLLGYRD